MKQVFLSFFLLLGCAVLASGHFVWVVPQADGTRATIILSEDLEPSGEVDIALISGAKLNLLDSKGRKTPLDIAKSDNAYTVALSGTDPRVVHGMVDLGVMQRGEGKPNLLIYYPKTILGDPLDKKLPLVGDVPVEIVPIGKPGAIRLKLLAKGKAQANVEITVILPDGKQKKFTTDSTGQTEAFTESGRYGAWARYWETVAGERQGKKYEEIRHYATLVFSAPAAASTSAVNQHAPMSAIQTATRFATLSQAKSSFGAVIDAGWLYVYGGHISPTHSYSTEAVSGKFDRLRLSDGKWEQLQSGPSLQGLNLAVHNGKIYRIGGMEPRNKPSERSDTWSIADCARFDPATMKWESLPSLPEPRSSHDVVVIGNKLIVSGGWALKGSADSEWMDTLNVMDLSAKPLKWTTVKQPFKRRALVAAAYAGKMYVIGGFDDAEQVSFDVDIYDPATDKWSKGPNLPGQDAHAFAPAACVHKGALYVSLADGALYRLNDSKQWEQTGKATPRLAHRIASDGKTILIIGGAESGNNSDLIETISVK